MPSDLLVQSTIGKIQLSKQIQNRIIRLGRMCQARGEVLQFPKHLQKAWIATRRLHARYKSGQYMHTQSEMLYENEIALWVVREWHRVNGTKSPY